MMYIGVLFPEVTVVKCEGLALVLFSVEVMTISSVFKYQFQGESIYAGNRNHKFEMDLKAKNLQGRWFVLIPKSCITHTIFGNH